MDVSGVGGSDGRGARLKYLTNIRPKSRHQRAQLLLDEGGLLFFRERMLNVAHRPSGVALVRARDERVLRIAATTQNERSSLMVQLSASQ